MLKQGAGHYEGDLWVNGWEHLEVKALHEGDEISPWETVMTIEGDYSEFAHLETVYLGVMARRTLIMRNVREVVEAARGKPILYFPARHDHWLVQTGDGWSAHIAGAIGVSTDAQASWWGGRGVGTVPHGLIAAYGGDTALAARKFADRFGRDMNVTVLVDFVNDSVRTALEVAEALGDDLWGVRLDTSDKLADESLRRLHGDDAPTGVAAELVELTRSELDTAGYPDVHIVVSGGFTADRIRAFEEAGVPVDSYGVGSSLIRGANDFTADVVMNDGKPCAKVGREYRPNPRLEQLGQDNQRDEAARARGPCARGRWACAATTNRRWSPSRPGRRGAPPTPSCSSSAGGMSSPAAAATLIASNGAVSGSPRAPSPTTSVTLWMPAASRLRRACSESAAWRSTLQTCAPRRREQRGVVARAGADVEDPLVAAAARAARTCGRRRAAGRSSGRRRSAAGRCPTPRRRAPAGRRGRAGRRASPPARARRETCGRSWVDQPRPRAASRRLTPSRRRPRAPRPARARSRRARPRRRARRWCRR